MKKYVNWSIFAAVGLLLAVAVTVFHFFILPIAIQYQVTKTLSLDNGTEAWDRFEETPIPIILKFYFFRMENPEDVLGGSKPNLTQVGPYVYREQWKKHDIVINEERDSIFYRQGIEFVFDRNMSGGLSDTDNLTTINPIIHMLATIIDGLPSLDLLDEALEFGLPELMDENYGPTMGFSVRDILFDGIVIPCNRTHLGYFAKLFCSALAHWQPTPNLYKDQYGNILFSVLNFKKMGPLYELSRGQRDPSTLGKILTVDGKTSFDAWRCDSANKVDGWDMVMFPPFITKSSVIPIYSPELRTSISMVYKDEASYEGIPGYKFGMGFDFLGDVKEDPKAKCYCPGSAHNMTIPHQCYEGKGVLELSSPLAVPAVLSLPHFYEASDNWLSQVDGLNPQPSLHESFLNIEPTTGVPLNGYKRVQVNVLTRPLKAVKLLKTHASALVPILWMEEGTGLGEKEIKMLRDQLLTLLMIVSIVRWCLFSVGLLIFVVGTLMAVWRRRQELEANRQQDLSQDSTPANHTVTEPT